jgi:DNA mismatch repair ATPase MutS
MFDIYDKLFDCFDQARHKLSRKKVAWKKIMLKDLIVTNAKVRQYYAKTQNSLNHLYEKAILLCLNKKNVIFQNANWKIFNDEISWSETYWFVFEEQFVDEYYDKEFVVKSRHKNLTRIDDLNIFLNVNVSFKEDENELTFYRKRDNSLISEILQYNF